MRRFLNGGTVNCRAEFSASKLYLAFWPSPERGTKTRASLWDSLPKDSLANSVGLFEYDWTRTDFRRIQV